MFRTAITILIVWSLLCPTFFVAAETGVGFDNIYNDQVIVVDNFLIKGHISSVLSFNKVEVAINDVWGSAKCLSDGCANWEYAWAGMKNGIYFVKARASNSEDVITDGTVILSVKQNVQFSPSKSGLVVNRAEAYAGNGDSIIALVTVVSDAGVLLSDNTVRLSWADASSEYAGYSAEGVTNEYGQVAFKIKSNQIGNFLLKAKVSGTEILQTQAVRFIEKPEDFTSGQLVKLPDRTTVYYLDKNDVLHPYPTQGVYESYWGRNFKMIKIISWEEIAKYDIGKNVPFKIGSLMKIQTVPKVYRIGNDGKMQWIVSEEVAQKLYGSNWNKLIYDLPEIFFTDYAEGEPIVE